MYDHRQLLMIEQGPYITVITNSVKGAVGEKEDDSYFMSTEVVGRHTIRMPLIELLSLGAKLQAVSVTVMNETAPTTEALLKGMQVELGSAQIPILVSSENNFKAEVTGVGVTLVGRVTKNHLLLGQVKAGDSLWLHGSPVAGMDVADNVHRLPTTDWIGEVAGEKGVHELILCGSMGIAKSLEKMCETYGLTFELDKTLGIDFYKSCGPYGGVVVAATDGFGRSDMILLGRLGI